MTSAPWPTAAMGRGPIAWSGHAVRPISQGERTIAALCFALLLFANLTMNSIKVGGIPVRSLMSAGMLALYAPLYPAQASAVLNRCLPLLALALLMAVQGAAVSFLAGTPPSIVFEAVSEIHFQMMVVVVVACLLAELAGARACMIGFVAVVSVSAVIAMLQFARVDAAWDARKLFGPLAKAEFEPNKPDRRPTGLAYSPIQLSTHLCLAFAVFTAVRSKLRRVVSGTTGADPAVLVAIGAFAVACIAAETRSPLLGVAIFLGIYLMMKRSWWLFFLIFGGGLAAYALWPLILSMIQSSAPRVVSTDDKSAAARWVFAHYGVRLFVDNPLGYGLAFKPEELWQRYWSELYLMRAAQGVQIHDLHNYFLSMLNMHGVGILLVAPLVLKLLRRSAAYLIFFIPYVVHISFHNSGPFYNDIVIWFAIGAVWAPVVQGGAVGQAAMDDGPARPLVTARRPVGLVRPVALRR